MGFDCYWKLVIGDPDVNHHQRTQLVRDVDNQRGDDDRGVVDFRRGMPNRWESVN